MKRLFTEIEKGEYTMILFVDETECKDYFIIAGLLTESKSKTDDAFKRFKKKVKNFPIPPKKKEKLFTEFKSVLLDKEYQKIKVCMLEHIDSLNYSVIYSVYKKDGNKFNQDIKERIYLQLLNNIVLNIDEQIDIIFDTFNKKDFEEKIINSIKLNHNVLSIIQQDSRLEFGLQFIDNICSVIRLHIDRKESTLYYLLSNYYEVN